MLLYEFTYTTPTPLESDEIEGMVNKAARGSDDGTWKNWHAIVVDRYTKQNGKTVYWVEVHGERRESLMNLEQLNDKQVLSVVKELSLSGKSMVLVLDEIAISSATTTGLFEDCRFSKPDRLFNCQVMVPLNQTDKIVIRGWIDPENVQIRQTWDEEVSDET